MKEAQSQPVSAFCVHASVSDTRNRGWLFFISKAEFAADNVETGGRVPTGRKTPSPHVDSAPTTAVPFSTSRPQENNVTDSGKEGDGEGEGEEPVSVSPPPAQPIPEVCSEFGARCSVHLWRDLEGRIPPPYTIRVTSYSKRYTE